MGRADSLEFVFRPLERWPSTRTENRRRAPFKAGYGRTISDLKVELGHLGTTRCVIQAECSENDIRLDGMLRSSAKMRGPGIILAFDSVHGPLQYPCDTYSDWTDNLRGIVLALRALRAVDRYGVTRRAEQYRGWKALPGGGQAPIAQAEWATVEEAARWMCKVAWPKIWDNENSQRIVADIAGGCRESVHSLYLECAKRLHPDSGGSSEEFQKLRRCVAYIKEAVGGEP